MPYAVILLIYSFDLNDLIKEYFTCFQNMSNSKLNCQSGHLRKGLVFESHVLDYSSVVFVFFLEGSEKARREDLEKWWVWKALLTTDGAMDEGVGSHQSELQKMKLESKQTYTYGHFLLLKLSMGWFPLNNTLWQEKAFFFFCRGE